MRQIIQTDTVWEALILSSLHGKKICVTLVFMFHHKFVLRICKYFDRAFRNSGNYFRINRNDSFRIIRIVLRITYTSGKKYISLKKSFIMRRKNFLPYRNYRQYTPTNRKNTKSFKKSWGTSQSVDTYCVWRCFKLETDLIQNVILYLWAFVCELYLGA